MQNSRSALYFNDEHKGEVRENWGGGLGGIYCKVMCIDMRVNSMVCTHFP
jgi:hypothetical protein